MTAPTTTTAPPPDPGVEDAAPATAQAGPHPRSWRRFVTRRSATVAVGTVLGIVLLALLALSSQRPTAPLDPDGTGPDGARALASVLADQGVEVDVVRSIGGLEGARLGRDTTVLVADPTNLGPGATDRLSRAVRFTGRLVVVGPTTSQLEHLEIPVRSFPGGVEDVRPRCTSSLARDDDELTQSDTRFVPLPAARGATSCYPLPGADGEPDPAGSGVALVELPAGAAHPDTVLVGVGLTWTNSTITQDSNAGVAVRTLGSTARLVWYQPGPSDLTAPGPGETEAGSFDVWPAWTWPATVLLFITVVLLALARGRRLGRLVKEPLPVVVRAVETTESRGRLYQRARDRHRAAAVLRLATRDRLGRRLAVPPAAGEAALVHAVATATGLPAHDVGGALAGPPPADDAALIMLAQQLTDLEERVRHS